MNGVTEAEQQEQLAYARWLFAQPCDFMLSVADLVQLPVSTLPEVAFVGRSNVGKSSLVNALTGRSTLAKTSNTPGRTQQLNFFKLAQRIHLVDLPGYGYAKVPEEIVKKWVALLKRYLAGRAELSRVYVLVDSRHGIKDSDKEMMDLLDSTAVPYQIVLTKADKLKLSEREQVLRATLEHIKKRPAALAEVFLTSSETRDGIDDVRMSIASFAPKV